MVNAGEVRFMSLPDREQAQLWAPSLRQVVDRERAVLIVDQAVDRLDLSALEARYALVGRPAHPPAIMVKALLYGQARRLRSGRELARACKMDLAFRFLTHGTEPDQATFSRFRRRHRDQLPEVLAQAVKLCRDAGLARWGRSVIAVHGSGKRGKLLQRNLRMGEG